MRRKAVDQCRELNNVLWDDHEERERLVRALFGSIGANPCITPPFFCDYGSSITAGDNLYCNSGCTVLDCAQVTIGDNVLLGPNVQIYTASHPTDPQQRLEHYEIAHPITIGNNVWIGGAAIICPGVTIGDDTTIGSGSVVTKSVPARVVAAGNPCRILKYLDAADKPTAKADSSDVKQAVNGVAHGHGKVTGVANPGVYSDGALDKFADDDIRRRAPSPDQIPQGNGTSNKVSHAIENGEVKQATTKVLARGVAIGIISAEDESGAGVKGDITILCKLCKASLAA